MRGERILPPITLEKSGDLTSTLVGEALREIIDALGNKKYDRDRQRLKDSVAMGDKEYLVRALRRLKLKVSEQGLSGPNIEGATATQQCENKIDKALKRLDETIAVSMPKILSTMGK